MISIILRRSGSCGALTAATRASVSSRRLAARVRTAVVTLAALSLLSSASCCLLPHRKAGARLEPLEQYQAVACINDNSARVEGVLKATGRVHAKVRAGDNKTRTFDLEGIMLFCSPENLYFELRHDLAGEQLIVGSNGRDYWYINKAEDEPPICRPYVQLVNGRDPDLPVQPGQIVEALGLSPLPTDAASMHGARMAQRVTDENQELLFVGDAPQGGARVLKEYWLSREGERVLRRIVFRDVMGRVEMESVLSGHVRLGDNGPFVPTHLMLSWPLEGSWLDFRVGRWTEMFDKGPDIPAFRPPGKSSR